MLRNKFSVANEKTSKEAERQQQTAPVEWENFSSIHQWPSIGKAGLQPGLPGKGCWQRATPGLGAGFFSPHRAAPFPTTGIAGRSPMSHMKA
jgi:hypothetical protein